MVDPRLDDLLDRYQELLDDGRVPDPDVLCRDCPDLRAELERRVARLQRLGAVLDDRPPPAPPPEPAPLSLSDDKTWVSGTAAPAAPVEIPAPPGYEVLEPLGEGGMGIVYKARQVGLNRLVALKMILAGTRARAIDLTRFRDEARAIAALHHPNIVQIYEVGEYRRQPFFSLEFCPGGTLAAALRGEPQPPDRAAAMAEVLARAVHSAHERQIVHRDLKPANVLLAVEPEEKGAGDATMVGDVPVPSWRHRALENPRAAFKITDFGLAKRVDSDSGQTLDGSVVGTPSYMAPEQARGDTRAIGPRSDVWALGAVLYEFLTGRPPFRGSSVLETLEQVRTRDPVPVRQLQPKVPADLETICLQCLEKDPAARYPSAFALADDLGRFREGRSIQARPVGQLTRAWRWCRREPRTAGLAAAVVVLLASVPALLVGYGWRLDRAEERVEEHRQAREIALRAVQAAHRASETHRYLANIHEAGRLRVQPVAGWSWDAEARALDAAAADTPDRDREVIRSELAAARGAIDLRRTAEWAEGLHAGALAFAPDGRLAVAPQLAQPVVSLRFVALVGPSGRIEQKLPFPGSVTRLGVDAPTALTFSPDGRWLVLGLRSGTVFRWDLRSGAAGRASWDAHNGPVVGLAFAPDSSWLYTAGHDGQVKRWPAGGTDPKPAARWPEPPADPADRRVTGLADWAGARRGVLAFGPDGARVLDPETLTPLAPTAVHALPSLPGSVGRIAVHAATGTVVVQRDNDLDVAYWEGPICRTVTRLRDPLVGDGHAHTDTIQSLALHPDGWLLATVSPEDGLAKIWDLTAGELVLTAPAPDGRAVAFSPDGRTLAVGGDHQTICYELRGDGPARRGRRGLPVQAMGWTADGRLATVAALRLPEQTDRASVVTTVWTPTGTPGETVVQQPENPVVTGHYRIAASPASGWTVFHAGDGNLIWHAPARAPTPRPNAALRPARYFDLSLDARGRAWTLAGDGRLASCPPGGGKVKDISTAWTFAAGRNELVCVRAGRGLVVAGCENAHVRVVPADGGRVRQCACFVKSAATVFTERANTVGAIDVRADETEAMAGTEDGVLWQVGLPTAVERAHWPAHAGRVTAVAYDQTGDWLASAGRDRAVRLWRRTATGFTAYLTLQTSRPVQQLAFGPTGDTLLVLVDGETAVREWPLARLRKSFRELGLDE